MSRGTITGTLHVRRQRKRPPGGLFAELVTAAAEDAGLVEASYYPPMLYMTNDETYDGEHSFIWKFRGVPKALTDAVDGSTVSVRATLEPWRNGIGAYLTRPEVLSLTPPESMPDLDPTRPPVPLDRIEAAAEDATEGPWEACDCAELDYGRTHVCGDRHRHRNPLLRTYGKHAEMNVFPPEGTPDPYRANNDYADATFIAACDPPTIKALTAALRRQHDTIRELIAGLEAAADGDPLTNIEQMVWTELDKCRREVAAAVSFSPTGGAE